MQVQLGNALFVVEFSNDYEDDPCHYGTPGSSEYAIVNRKQLAELFAACPFELYGLDADDLTFNPEKNDASDEIQVPSGDDFIVFVNAASIEGGTWTITYYGSPYWFFHDLSHAQYDCRGGTVYIDSEGLSENRALYDSAVSAFEHGVGLSVILKELGQALKPYENRFHRDTDVIERFAEYLKNHLTTQAI